MKKYNELSKKAKHKACLDYSKGWLVTHPKEEIDLNEADEILRENVEDEYKKNGEYISE